MKSDNLQGDAVSFLSRLVLHQLRERTNNVFFSQFSLFLTLMFLRFLVVSYLLYENRFIVVFDMSLIHACYAHIYSFL